MTADSKPPNDEEHGIGRALQQFSCPEQTWDDRIAAAITSASESAVVDQFLERFREELGASSTGLVQVLRLLQVDEDAGDAAWDPTFGSAERAAQSGCVDPVPIAATLALRGAGIVNEGEWKVKLRHAARLRWRSWLLPPAQEFSVRYSPSAATVTIRDARGSLRKLVLDTTSRSATGCESLPRVGTQGSIVLLPESAVPTDLLQDSEGLGLLSVSRIEPPMVLAIEKALELLAEYAPQYRDWVTRVVFEIMVCKHEPDRSRSGSWLNAPGSVHLSWSTDSVAVAEALVHEASHQYAYQVYRASALDDGSDAELYYSPAVGTKRSLERILFAYHAFANVLLFYRTATANGIPKTASASSGMERIRALVEQLEVPLQNNAALTTVGNSLYRPLSDRLKSDDA